MSFWWEDDRIVGMLGLQIVEYDDPQLGKWIECIGCTSAIWCLRRVGLASEKSPTFGVLACENGCNKAEIEHPPIEVLLVALGD
jgi:hypothetical protein